MLQQPIQASFKQLRRISAVEIASNDCVPLIMHLSWSEEPITRWLTRPNRRISSEALELGKLVDRA